MNPLEPVADAPRILHAQNYANPIFIQYLLKINGVVDDVKGVFMLTQAFHRLSMHLDSGLPVLHGPGGGHDKQPDAAFPGIFFGAIIEHRRPDVAQKSKGVNI
ncbi:MAG: hypothetical protein PVF79_05450 [Desulfobacterales bacterium]|jgi:hypothetical protein